MTTDPTPDETAPDPADGPHLAATPEPAEAEAPPPSAEAPTSTADAPVPTEAELARTATPATVRRAPRFGAFLATGAVVGAVAGLLLAALVHPGGAALDGTVGFISFLDGQGAARFFTALAGAAAGALLGGLAAVLADRRSLHRR